MHHPFVPMPPAGQGLARRLPARIAIFGVLRAPGAGGNRSSHIRRPLLSLIARPAPCWLRGAISMSGLALRYRDQKGRCLYCRRIMSFSQKCTHPEGRRITREHLIPRSKGGKGGANVVAACYRCNAARGDKPWLSFYCSPAVTHFRFEGRRETIEGPDIKTDEPIGAICE